MVKSNLAEILEQNIWFMKLPGLNNKIITSFNNLPKDKYLQGNQIFRYRRYHTGAIINDKYTWDATPNYFFQSSKINGFIGDVKRFFDPIEKDAKDFIQNHIIPFAALALPKANYTTGTHQIRVSANDTIVGKPAPEGIHQDGFDYVSVVCIATENVAGGNSLVLEKETNIVIYDEVMKPCDFILFRDDIYTHYVSPVVPKLPGQGYRDVIVTTFKEV